MEIGSHCSILSCNALDFLPIKCNLCSNKYCTTHSTNHSCSNIDNSRNNVKGNIFEEKFNDLLPDINRGLGQEYEKERDNKRRRTEAAQELIKKNFGTSFKLSSGGKTTTTGSDVKKTVKINPVIELMKLKQRAKQGDPRKSIGEVPMDSRIYFKVVYFEQEGDLTIEKGMKELWLPRVTSTGKALDLFAVHFGVENVNNISKDLTKLLLLATLSTESEPARRLSPELELSSAISNGGILHLLKGASIE